MMMRTFYRFLVYTIIAAVLFACKDQKKTPLRSITPYPNTFSLSVLSTLTPAASTASPEREAIVHTPVYLPAQATYIPGFIITPPPTRFATATPVYRHYSPKKNSLLRFEFEYPSHWEKEEKYPSEWGLIIFENFNDPESRILLVVLEQGIDDINDEIESTLHSPKSGGKILEDKYVRIDGYEARWILVEMPTIYYPDDVKPQKESVELHIFLIVADDGYWFYLRTPVKDKDGQFARDFRAMIMGMKYIP